MSIWFFLRFSQFRVLPKNIFDYHLLFTYFPGRRQTGKLVNTRTTRLFECNFDRGFFLQSFNFTMEDRVYDTMFTEEISNKMQVPKSIKVNGDVSNFRPTSFNGDDINRYGDNFDMRVPEKIILLGKFV